MILSFRAQGGVPPQSLRGFKKGTSLPGASSLVGGELVRQTSPGGVKHPSFQILLQARTGRGTRESTCDMCMRKNTSCDERLVGVRTDTRKKLQSGEALTRRGRFPAYREGE
jgi:hypothetical protein